MAAAVTLAKIWHTPYAVAYLATHAGGAGDASVNVDYGAGATPDLNVDTNTGAADIRAVVAATYAAQANARAAFGAGTATAPNPLGKILVVPRTGTASANWKADADVNGTACRITVNAEDDGTAVIVLRRIHSTGK